MTTYDVQDAVRAFTEKQIMLVDSVESFSSGFDSCSVALTTFIHRGKPVPEQQTRSRRSRTWEKESQDDMPKSMEMNFVTGINIQARFKEHLDWVTANSFIFVFTRATHSIYRPSPPHSGPQAPQHAQEIPCLYFFPGVADWRYSLTFLQRGLIAHRMETLQHGFQVASQEVFADWLG